MNGIQLVNGVNGADEPGLDGGVQVPLRYRSQQIGHEGA